MPLAESKQVFSCPFWDCGVPLGSKTPAALEEHLDAEHGCSGCPVSYCKVDGCNAILEFESMLDTHMIHEHWSLCN